MGWRTSNAYNRAQQDDDRRWLSGLPWPHRLWLRLSRATPLILMIAILAFALLR